MHADNLLMEGCLESIPKQKDCLCLALGGVINSVIAGC